VSFSLTQFHDSEEQELCHLALQLFLQKPHAQQMTAYWLLR
jgi:hypothetical protein